MKHNHNKVIKLSLIYTLYRAVSLLTTWRMAGYVISVAVYSGLHARTRVNQFAVPLGAVNERHFVILITAASCL